MGVYVCVCVVPNKKEDGMQTRFQTRVACTHAVLLNMDLLTCILAFVNGTSPRSVPGNVLPRVCAEWNRAWRILVSRVPRCPDYRFGPHLSIVQREARTRQLAYVTSEFHRLTAALRNKCMRMLRCNRDGVPTLLGHVVIQIAFSLATPINRPGVTSPKLWEYVVRIRQYVAAALSKNPPSSLRPLPTWYRIHPDDPLHAVLLG